jgi:hypothetical protein
LQKLVATERELRDQLIESSAECERLRSRERALEKDLKKRGDAARQLVLTKDEEIARLRKKLAKAGTGYTGTELSVDSSLHAETVPSAPSTPLVIPKSSFLPEPSTPIHESIASPAHAASDQLTDSPHRVDASSVSSHALAMAIQSPMQAAVPKSPRPPGTPGGAEVNPEQFVYLRQAFFAFMKSRDSSEMQQIGKVISVVLGMSPEEQAVVQESIAKLSPTISIDNLSSNIASYFFR